MGMLRRGLLLAVLATAPACANILGADFGSYSLGTGGSGAASTSSASSSGSTGSSGSTSSTSSGASSGSAGSSSTSAGSSSSSGTGGAAVGTPCSTGTACATGFCIDGVCCDLACAGACEACSAALTGGTDGACSSATDGTSDPRGLCAPTSATSCKTDGKCQGGACEDWGPSTVCASASCSSGTATLAGHCDGSGSCAGGATASCGAYLCNGASCGTSCTVDADCAAQNHCKSGACVGDGGPGAGCSTGADCTNGLCGKNLVCCAAACPDQGAASCGTSGVCALGTGACGTYAAGTTCGVASCANGAATAAKTCDAAGGCSQGGGVAACSPYVCGATSCLAACTSDASCAAGFFCAGTICTAKQPVGAACSAPDACASGFCVDGVCCATACTSSCEACSAALTGAANGTCATVADGTADPRGVCAATPATSCGTDGKCHGGGCEEWPSGTACAQCSGGSVTSGTCSGAGACQGTATSCGAFACSGAACATSCTTNAACATGYHCNGATCVVNGTGCSVDTDCSIAGQFCWLGACVTITSIVPAGSFTCALTSAGGVQCWGYGSDGEIGNGATAAMTNTPAAVSGLASGVSSLGGGYSSTCVVTAAGAVLCWGDNMYGQLGDGTTTSRDVPTQVKGLTSGAKAVASGLTMSCALMTSGGVKCWGTNPQGQLGNGGTTNSATPVDVTGLGSAVSAISAGANHMCAILSATGGVQCWGANDQGQLGDSSLNDSSVPVSVPGLASGVKGVAAGNEHTCALLSSGAVSCWGNNMYGQLGDGTKTYKTTPTAVTGLGAGSGVVTITTGNYQSCALMSGGTTQCWGFNGTYGQFGNNSMVNSTSPIGAAILPSGTASIALGGSFFACGVNTIGRPYCWGWNDYGQLGDNAAEMVSLVPVAVSEP